MSSKSLSQDIKDEILSYIKNCSLTAQQISDLIGPSIVTKQQIQNLLYSLEDIRTEKTSDCPPKWSLIDRNSYLDQTYFEDSKITSDDISSIGQKTKKYSTKVVKKSHVTLPEITNLENSSSTKNLENSSSTKNFGNSKILYIILDLGNVHDCLNELDRLDLGSQSIKVYSLANQDYNGYGVSPKCINKNILFHQYDIPHSGGTDVEITHMFTTMILSKMFNIIIVSKSKKIFQLLEIAKRIYTDTKVHINLKIVDSWDTLKPLLSS